MSRSKSVCLLYSLSLSLSHPPGGWDLVGIASSNWSINSSQFLQEKIVGSPAFFSLTVQVDDKNSSVNVLTVCMVYLYIRMYVRIMYL